MDAKCLAGSDLRLRIKRLDSFGVKIFAVTYLIANYISRCHFDTAFDCR
jgi:hypothetical protein